MSNSLELRLVPGVDGLDKSHHASGQAAEEFYTDMLCLPGVAITERDVETTVSATKGMLQQLVAAPESASAAWAVVKLVKLWLSRDRRRTLTITVSRPGHEPVTIQASGDSISVQALDSAIHDALEASA